MNIVINTALLIKTQKLRKSKLRNSETQKFRNSKIQKIRKF